MMILGIETIYEAKISTRMNTVGCAGRMSLNW